MSDTKIIVPSDIQSKVRRFFEVYDPQRLESSDFTVLLRYILNRGLPALEEKLLKKYGVNIASMQVEQEKSKTRKRQSGRAVQKKVNGQAISPLVLPGDPEEQDVTKQGVEKKPSELTELDDLPEPPLLPPIKVEKKRKTATHSQLLQEAAGMSPDMLNDDPARANLFGRLTEYYRKHNQEKLQQGIGDVVEYAMKKGEDRINQKLKQTYGEDLYSFELNIKKGKMKSTRIEQQQMKQEEALVGEMRPERQKLRQRLIDFFIAVEPPRAALVMDPLLDYAEKFGLGKLNQKLFNKYGYNLEEKPPNIGENQSGFPGHVLPPVAPREPTQELATKRNYSFNKMAKEEKFDADLKTMKKGDLPDYVRLMLGRYYAKYDQAMLQDGGVEAVYQWTKRNGLDKLNKKLFERYGQSLQDFISAANELRDDLIEFYRHRDRNKLVLGIQPILDWGLRNGRAALNEKLRSKYGVDLELDIYQEVMESASQF